MPSIAINRWIHDNNKPLGAQELVGSCMLHRNCQHDSNLGRKSSQWHEHLNDHEELKRSQFSQLSYVLFFRLRKSKQSLVVAVYAFSAPVQHFIPVLFFIRPSRLCPRLVFKRECHYAICRNATTQILLVSTCWRVSVPETIQLKHFTHFLLW